MTSNNFPSDKGPWYWPSISQLSRIRPLLQLPFLCVAIFFLACIATIFSAPIHVWFISWSLIIYLLLSGTGGIIPAITWTSFLVLSIIVANTRPELWEHLPRYRYWARVLGSIWIAGTGIAFLIGEHGNLCSRYPQNIRNKLQAMSVTSSFVGGLMGKLLFDVEG